MAITLRFPNGSAVTYNDAAKLIRYPDYWKLITRDETLVACFPANTSIVVEFFRPCSVVPLAKGVEQSIDCLLENVREVAGWGNVTNKLSELKVLLKRWNRRTRSWRADPQ